MTFDVDLHDPDIWPSDGRPEIVASLRLDRNRMSVDGPVPGATVPGAFALDGWAFEEASATDEGLDTIHVWALPIAGGAPQFLGVPTIGLPRPDVAAYFGKPNVAHSGFHLDAPALPPGTYYVVVFVHSRISGTFNFYRFFPLVVAP